ncbi:hypothetical protein BDP55DRAFT_634613 [Colletotrichum godetiae]|uniref:Azaphilone pigments biosynthesis cluster protein L N-terminal domain-containing protein n=1 Tax=Colletotrichum godetiae TaxID=1209918 RepID=A0AAJ0AFC4_9PEZI|nr:uncharacterized protein BDP55DRAFT_634613 [Colletotrichum godetiae]KAK1672859.1 hypothetical protein BDP55DRAFT_634613 [Colletotrichum godetiae]
MIVTQGFYSLSITESLFLYFASSPFLHIDASLLQVQDYFDERIEAKGNFLNVLDPLSVSSGVAGLISLGITVCKGLNTFCQDYGSRDFDIINLKEHAHRLDSFLHLVQIRLQACHKVDSALSASLQNCFGACWGCIQEFESLAKKQARLTGPKGIKEYGKDVARHLQYPLQKAEFDRLKAEMQDFYAAMTNYLLLINQ